MEPWQIEDLFCRLKGLDAQNRTIIVMLNRLLTYRKAGLRLAKTNRKHGKTARLSATKLRARLLELEKENKTLHQLLDKSI